MHLLQFHFKCIIISSPFYRSMSIYRNVRNPGIYPISAFKLHGYINATGNENCSHFSKRKQNTVF